MFTLFVTTVNKIIQMNKFLIFIISTVIFSCSAEVPETIPEVQEADDLVLDTIPLVTEDLTLGCESIFTSMDTTFRN